MQKGDFDLSEKGFVDHKPYLVHYCMDCVDDIIDEWEGKIEADDGYERWRRRYDYYRRDASRG